MVSNVKGTFGKMAGTITWDGKDVSTVKAEATIDATTITTRNQKRDDHLKSPDFFDAAKYPTISFIFEARGASVQREVPTEPPGLRRELEPVG